MSKKQHLRHFQHRIERSVIIREHLTDSGKPKKAFPTYRDAQASCRTIRENGGERMHIYRCRICGKFHIGHNH